MEIVVVKILSALVLWILSLCFGLMVPYLIWKSRAGYHEPDCQNEFNASESESLLSDDDVINYDARTSNGRWNTIKTYFNKSYTQLCNYDIISLINCFCGGLFLGICLLELLPEARECVDTILADVGVDTRFPVTEFMVSIGLLLVMFVEHLVSDVCARKRASKRTDYDVINEGGSQALPIDDAAEQCVTSSINDVDVQTTSRRNSAEASATSEATRSLILIGMLSVHSIFEGLALGLEATVSQLIQLLVAVSVHKSVLAFGLGLKLFETFAPGHVTTAIACVLIFCTGSPLGCTIGLFMTPYGGNTSHNTSSTTTAPTESIVDFDEENLSQIPGTLYATAILECLATGTFLYVTFIEVIPSEFSHTNDYDVIDGQGRNRRRSRKIEVKPMYKLLTLLLGFSAVTGLQFV